MNKQMFSRHTYEQLREGENKRRGNVLLSKVQKSNDKEYEK